MKVYTSCFIGIPLPKEYKKEFELLLKDINKICSSFELVEPKTPHITLYYLDKQSQNDLPEITKSVESVIDLLKNTEITVGGLGSFGGDDPRVLFLNVLYPKVLKEFNQSVTQLLRNYYADDNALPFHPHMTTARIITPGAKQDVKESISKLKERLDKISWTFPVTEVVLYGVDSTTHPEHHEKIITISTN